MAQGAPPTVTREPLALIYEEALLQPRGELRYSARCLRRFAQYRFIRSETSRRSLALMDFLPRRFPPRGKIGAPPAARCNSSNEAITRSSFSFSA